MFRRSGRPFPGQEMADALRDKAVVGVMDRSDSFGALGGPLFMELSAAFKIHDVPAKTVDYVFGLGGRDIAQQQLKVWVDAMRGRGARGR